MVSLMTCLHYPCCFAAVTDTHVNMHCHMTRQDWDLAQDDLLNFVLSLTATRDDEHHL